MAKQPQHDAQLTQSKKRKKRANTNASTPPAFVGGWQKVDLDDVEVEGFEDGCAFELEEMTGAFAVLR